MKNSLHFFEQVHKTKFNQMKSRFYLHSYINKDEEQQIVFSVHIDGQREKFYTGYFCSVKNWNPKTQRVKHGNDINLILDNMISKATEIRTFYRLTHNQLSSAAFKIEFLKKSPSYDFIAFLENQLPEILNANTRKKHKSIHKKLKAYKEILPFNQISLEFFDQYRIHLKKIGNSDPTINSNIKIIKQYILKAKRNGVIFNFNFEDVKVGSTSGNRSSINLEQTKKLVNYYFSEFIKPNHRLSLGYFLFACYTGLRISDIENLSRADVLCDEIYFKTVKTKKQQTILLNNTIRKIVDEDLNLFVTFKAQQVINRELKDIATHLGIMKNLTLHVGRHTFATNFLRKGGAVQDLQLLLGHSSISTTMEYVHIVESEAIKSVFLLDD